ncbi:MAG TPA: UbiD family decarboxylase, partial [Burkholderiales bacterium]|nr:UbiD family decarboxylase [Burkholderiales bacterium]
LAESVNERASAPAILFEDIPGYPEGFRALSGSTNSMKRLAITLGFPVPSHPLDVVRAYRDRMKTHAPIPPRAVGKGPVLENVLSGNEVDVLKFPVPFLHEQDGGRYIGTDDLVIMRDPEGGWVNCGTYRVMVHDAKRVGVWMSPGKHGRQIREKYFKQGKPCPVLVSCGHDPMLFLAGGNELRFGLSEYDYAGGHRGLPFDVIESEIHGLPMPAHAEIVLEGEMLPGETAPEGPFGEFTGYYAGGQSDQPVIRVQRVYHRNDPILTLATPMRPPSDFSYSKCVMKAGMIWDEVERAGLSGVKGVWCHEAGGARMFNVIAIRPAYAGHAKQAAMAAASCQSGSYLGRFVVVVDEDIDPTNLFEVLWAMCTRCDPAEDIDIVRKMWSGPLDPRIPRGASWNSRAVIDACRPYEMLKEFPPVARATPELRAKVEAKFRDILSKL